MDIDPRWWDTASFDGKPVSAFLAERDVSAILRFLRTRGFSRARLAAMTGLSETRVRQVSQGRQRVTSYEVLERIADGLSIPRPAEQVADHFAESGYAFVEDDKIDGLAALLASFLTTAGIPVNRPRIDDSARVDDGSTCQSPTLEYEE